MFSILNIKNFLVAINSTIEAWSFKKAMKDPLW